MNDRPRLLKYHRTGGLGLATSAFRPTNDPAPAPSTPRTGARGLSPTNDLRPAIPPDGAPGVGQPQLSPFLTVEQTNEQTNERPREVSPTGRGAWVKLLTNERPRPGLTTRWGTSEDTPGLVETNERGGSGYAHRVGGQLHGGGGSKPGAGVPTPPLGAPGSSHPVGSWVQTPSPGPGWVGPRGLATGWGMYAPGEGLPSTGTVGALAHSPHADAEAPRHDPACKQPCRTRARETSPGAQYPGPRPREADHLHLPCSQTHGPFSFRRGLVGSKLEPTVRTFVRTVEVVVCYYLRIVMMLLEKSSDKIVSVPLIFLPLILYFRFVIIVLPMFSCLDCFGYKPLHFITEVIELSLKRLGTNELIQRHCRSPFKSLRFGRNVLDNLYRVTNLRYAPGGRMRASVTGPFQALLARLTQLRRGVPYVYAA